VLVVLSADMEGVSGLRSAREIVAACPEYWETGKPRYEEEVAAACEGLLAGGATEVVVLDNHASGNPANIAADALPARARVETWNVWDLPELGVDAMFQVGYHARGGVNGFLSHTYGLDLRLRCGDELISESHGRAWAARTRLIGITGNDLHEQTLGSLSGTPYLVVQRSAGHEAAEPVAGLDEINEFARACAESAGDIAPVDPPGAARLPASMPHGATVEATMNEGGWARTGEVEYEIALDSWQDARAPVGAAMLAAFAPVLHVWSNELTSPERASAYDDVKRESLRAAIDTWAETSGPEWFTESSPSYGKSRDTLQPPPRFRT
jgi:D-amino peptidase